MSLSTASTSKFLMKYIWQIIIYTLTFTLLPFCSAFLLPDSVDKTSNIDDVKTSEKCNPSVLCTANDTTMAKVCGTDGRTYYSICGIKKAVCNGEPVQKYHDGPCFGNESCPLARKFRTQIAAKQGNYVFIPECNKTDQSYLPTQCFKKLGYCWCVDKDGRPIQGTSVKDSTPICHHGKERVIIKVGRRSHRTNDTLFETTFELSSSKGCTAVDRSNFNDDFYKQFQKDYGNTGMHSQDVQKPLGVIIRKFAEYDTDQDSLLNRSEVKKMKKELRKKDKFSRPCLRRLFRNCDFNGNNTIEIDEWIRCLGVNISSSYDSFDSLRDNASFYYYKTENSFGKLDNVRYASSNGSDLEISLKNNISNRPLPANNRIHKKYPAVEHDNFFVEEECSKAREKALTSSDPRSYVPSCIGPDDLYYNATQCYPQENLCWCVEPNGAVIFGSAASSNNIKCDSGGISKFWQTLMLIKNTTNNRINNISGFRSLNRNKTKGTGCLLKKMKRFIRIHSENLKRICCEVRYNCKSCPAAATTASTSSNCRLPSGISDEELLHCGAKLSFERLDTNHNLVLEKNEWRVYKAELNKAECYQRTRKCARLYMRYCDGDNNMQITESEWMSCTVGGHLSIIQQLMRITNPFLDVLRYEV
uniref:SPARC-related modular calcium-binding protein 1 n=1 Tax=Syphacia muris TaxID=451379 RepID=A0A0N5AAY3_9BILA